MSTTLFEEDNDSDWYEVLTMDDDNRSKSTPSLKTERQDPTVPDSIAKSKDSISLRPMLEARSNRTMCPLIALLMVRRVFALYENEEWQSIDHQEQHVRGLIEKEESFEWLLRHAQPDRDCRCSVAELLDSPIFSSRNPSFSKASKSVIERSSLETVQNLLGDHPYRMRGLSAAILDIPTEPTASGVKSTAAAVCFKICHADKSRHLLVDLVQNGDEDTRTYRVRAICLNSEGDAASLLTQSLQQEGTSFIEAHFLTSGPTQAPGDAPPPPYTEVGESDFSLREAVPHSSIGVTTQGPDRKLQTKQPAAQLQVETVQPRQRASKKPYGQDISWMLSLQSTSKSPVDELVHNAEGGSTPKENIPVKVYQEDQLNLLFKRPQSKTKGGRTIHAKQEAPWTVVSIDGKHDHKQGSTQGRDCRDEDLEGKQHTNEADMVRKLVGRSQPPRKPSSKVFRNTDTWSPLMLRPELGSISRPQQEKDYKDKGKERERDPEEGSTYGRRDKGKQRERIPESETDGQDIAYRAIRNDFAWQIALASTSLKPSEDYMKEREERVKQRKIQLGQVPFDCLVCFETIEWEDGARMTNCEHAFCKDCVEGHVVSKLDDNQYPVVCPICLADRQRTKRGFVDEALVLELGIPDAYHNKYVDLQIAQLSVQLDCPACKQTMKVVREDYLAEAFITCPLVQCSNRFCRACQMILTGSNTDHACKVDETLDKLMQANGWRYCPGCRTPIQKESGCNHMTCGTPGCSTHFCYTCGVLIWDSKSMEPLSTSLSAHYTSCIQFDDRPRRNNNANNNANADANHVNGRGRRRLECLHQ